MQPPSPDALSHVLRDLFGRQVTLKTGGAIAPLKVALAAVYQDAEGKPLAVGLTDVACAAYSGAALAMIPKGVADDSVKRAKLEDNLLENFHEVVNILASTLNTSGSHVRLAALVAPKDLSADAQAIVKKPRARVDFDLTIADFGAGKLSFLVA